MVDFFSVETQQSRLTLLQKQQQEISDSETLPRLETIRSAESTLPSPDKPGYLSSQPADVVAEHITRDIIPALNGQGRSSRYYGFVTGGVLPVAEWADNVVSHLDQNVQVHLPGQTVATALEDKALAMLADLLRLGGGWEGRTFTTGATGSNILGLACGREAILARRLGDDLAGSVGELGLLKACIKAGVTDLQVLTSAGHSSLSKAASVVGLGRQSVKELGLPDEPWRLDIDAVEVHLKKPGTASIIAVSAGEVNTGRYAVQGVEEMRRLRAMADKHGAWIHVDGGECVILCPFSFISSSSLEYPMKPKGSEEIG